MGDSFPELVLHVTMPCLRWLRIGLVAVLLSRFCSGRYP